ncbi:MAG TPA: hypothetical protein VMW23_04235, partial [Sedimentisphaerales bacterium]|nr:hypothetical protein [Sedimentisphaerales bacterium]
KAEELYIVRDKFKELYEQYKKAAGLNDGQLMPLRRVSEARCVSPMEGSLLQGEEMAKMKVGDVLDYILEPKNYEVKKKPGEWIEPREGLAATFQEDVKKRAIEYLKEGKEKLANLPAGFLTDFFYGVSGSVRAKSFAKEGWGDFIDLADELVRGNYAQQEFTGCFSAILIALRDGFGEGEIRIDFDDCTAEKVWEILEVLVHSSRGDTATPREEGAKEDPTHTMLTLVTGQAMELTVSFGIICKTKLTGFYESFVRDKMRECWNFVADTIRQPGVNCAFGLNFARICWLDEEWVQTGAANIFRPELWDETWGTYVSWGRPSARCFRILIEQGMYGQAVELLGRGYEYGYPYRKKPDEGLVEHLMIGFFNGWIEFEHAVLNRFFENATAELRGKAAKFLTTGFKAVNEQGGTEKENVAVRMREYWNKRVAAIKDNAEKDEKEAMELTGWVADSVLPAKETLGLLDESLNLSGGKIGRMGDARDFAKGVCRLGEGNELLALRCLKKAAVDENMHMTWARIQEPLVDFLGAMVDMPEDVRSAAIEVADAYGRYNPDKFRGVWEKLDKRK